MHPLQELELFYLDVRRQVDARQLPPQEGLKMVNERGVTDAAGVVWRVDVQRSSSERAAFLCAVAGQAPLPGDPSRFAFAQPSTTPSPAAGNTPPAGFPGGYQLGAVGSGPSAGGIPGMSQMPAAGGVPPMSRQTAPTAASEESKKSKRQKKEKQPREGGRLASLTGGFELTPRVITGLVIAFVVLTVAFMFFKMKGGSTAASKTSPTTTAIAIVQPTQLPTTTLPAESVETTTTLPAADPTATAPSTAPTTAPASTVVAPVTTAATTVTGGRRPPAVVATTVPGP